MVSFSLTYALLGSSLEGTHNIDTFYLLSYLPRAANPGSGERQLEAGAGFALALSSAATRPEVY